MKTPTGNTSFWQLLKSARLLTWMVGATTLLATVQGFKVD